MLRLQVREFGGIDVQHVLYANAKIRPASSRRNEKFEFCNGFGLRLACRLHIRDYQLADDHVGSTGPARGLGR
jgi:hypothetical protein